MQWISKDCAQSTNGSGRLWVKSRPWRGQNEDNSFPREQASVGAKQGEVLTELLESESPAEAWPECQALYQLSMATIMLHNHHPRTSAYKNKHLFLVTNSWASWAFLLVWTRVIWAYSCVCVQLMGHMGISWSWMTLVGWLMSVSRVLSCHIRLACVCSCQLS